MEVTQDYYSEKTSTFGDRIAAARDSAGYDAGDLAIRLGVHKNAILDWENDQAEPSANKLQMLAGVLNVSVRWLLTGVGADVTEPSAQTTPAVASIEVQSELLELRAAAEQLTAKIIQLEKRLGSRAAQ